MRNIAPGIVRRFDFTRWKCTPSGVLQAAREEARDLENRTPLPPLFASDVSDKAIEIARFHAARAGVEKDIRFCLQDMRQFSSEERFGVLISNPPYGERMGDTDLRGLYRDFGKVFRSLPDWSCYFLSAYDGAERAFGMRADKKRRLWNGQLACTLYAVFGASPCKK